MSGTILGICTAVPLAHDGSTAGDHPVVAGWLSPVYCSCGLVVGYMYRYTEYLSLSYNRDQYYAGKNLQKLDYNGFGVLWYYRFSCSGSCRRIIFLLLSERKMLLLGDPVLWASFGHPVPLSTYAEDLPQLWAILWGFLSFRTQRGPSRPPLTP